MEKACSNIFKSPFKLFDIVITNFRSKIVKKSFVLIISECIEVFIAKFVLFYKFVNMT